MNKTLVTLAISITVLLGSQKFLAAAPAAMPHPHPYAKAIKEASHGKIALSESARVISITPHQTGAKDTSLALWEGAVAPSSLEKIIIPTAQQTLSVKNPDSAQARKTLAKGKAIQFPSKNIPGKEIKAFLVQTARTKRTEAASYALALSLVTRATEAASVKEQEFRALVDDVRTVMSSARQKKAQQTLKLYRDLHLVAMKLVSEQPLRSSLSVTDTSQSLITAMTGDRSQRQNVSKGAVPLLIPTAAGEVTIIIPSGLSEL